jgi:rubrerythrin
MISPLRDSLAAQIEIFKALELAAARDYGIIEQELINLRFKKTMGAIRDDEMSHATLCQEIIDFLKK